MDVEVDVGVGIVVPSPPRTEFEDDSNAMGVDGSVSFAVLRAFEILDDLSGIRGSQALKRNIPNERNTMVIWC